MSGVTVPLREEHATLLPHVHELDSVAREVRAWPRGTEQRLHDIVEFLNEHLLPHARAEEAELYPRVEAVMSAPGATATMAADHREVLRRTQRLSADVAALGPQGPSDEGREDLQAQLFGLHAILLLHFRKEEEVLLPVLDEALTQDQADDMFAAMAAVAHAKDTPTH